MTSHPASKSLDAAYADTRARALAGSWAMLLRHVAIVVLSAGGTTYLVREVGPALWGGFAISYLLLVAADYILTRGLMAGLLRRAVPTTEALVSSGARLALLAGGATAGTIALLAAVLWPIYSPPGLTLLLLSTSVTVLFYSARALPLMLIERELRYRVVAAAEVADMATFYAVAVPCVWAGLEVEGLVAGTLARGVVSLSILRHAARAPWTGMSARFAAARLLPFGLPLAAVTVVTAVEGLVPTVLIGRNESAVGFFLLAASALGYATAVGAIVQRVAVPGLARLRGPALMQAIERSLELSSFLTLSVLVPAGALAAVWVEPVLGEEWEGAVPMFELIAVAMMPSGPINVLVAALTAEARPGTVLRVQIIASGAYVLAGIAGAMAIGPEGVAVGLIVSRWLWAISLLLRARDELGLRFPREALASVAWASVIFGGLTLCAHANSVALVMFSAIALAVWLVVCRHSLRRSLRGFLLVARPARRH